MYYTPLPRSQNPLRSQLDAVIMSLEFMVISSPDLTISLGLTWLCKHNPHIDWASCEILSWGSSCSASCISTANANMLVTAGRPIAIIYISLFGFFQSQKELSLDSSVDLHPSSVKKLSSLPLTLSLSLDPHLDSQTQITITFVKINFYSKP